jgi:hypothetical protein
MANKGLLLLGGAGVLAYLTRNSWLPIVSPAPVATATGVTGNDPNAPTLTTANQPISGYIPGAVPIGTEGCYAYPNGTAGSMVMNCPPGVNPPPTSAPVNSCAAGFTLDPNNVCTKYSDGQLLANINSIPWTGSTDVPTEQIQRIDPQILEMYTTLTGINAGTVLAYMLGLGSNPADGTIAAGTDGNVYKALGGVFYRQGTATTASTQPVNPTARKYTLQGLRGTRMGSLGSLTAALMITPNILVKASADPDTAKMVGRDDRAMLTAAQWNGYYTQATGMPQGIPLHPADMRGALMSAEQYQARRRAAGLMIMSNLGTLRPARRGAFPLGGLGIINQWVPPGNRTIYQVPGRGAVPSVRGKIPPRGKMGVIDNGGGNHRWARSPFPRPAWWRDAE